MPGSDSGERGIGQDASDSAGDPGQGARQVGEPKRPEMRTGDEPEVPDERTHPDGPPDSTGRRYVRRAVRESVALVVVVGWLGFWLNIASLHLQEGAMAEAVLTAVLFAAPAAVAYLWHLNNYFGLVDLPRPSLG